MPVAAERLIFVLRRSSLHLPLLPELLPNRLGDLLAIDVCNVAFLLNNDPHAAC